MPPCFATIGTWCSELMEAEEEASAPKAPARGTATVWDHCTRYVADMEARGVI